MTLSLASTVTFRFRLFVAGGTPNSTQALANLNALCRGHMPDRHEIEVVDVLARPELALAEGIFMTPMLIVLEPLPQRRIAGTLSNRHVLADQLGLERVGE